MKYEDYRTLLVERVGRVLRLTLNRPDRLNAVTPKMHTEITNIFGDIRHDPDADVITITGAGRGFCAGADLKEPPPKDDAVIDKVFYEAREILLNILEIDKPIISAVNGPATGLGVTLALFADIVIASDRARFGDTHVKVGLTAGDGVSGLQVIQNVTDSARKLVHVKRNEFLILLVDIFRYSGGLSPSSIRQTAPDKGTAFRQKGHKPGYGGLPPVIHRRQ